MGPKKGDGAERGRINAATVPGIPRQHTPEYPNLICNGAVYALEAARMSIEQTDTIDLIGIERESDKVVLTVCDDLNWSDSAHHLQLLQDKINTYVAFIKSGEILETYPKSAGRQVVIEVVTKHELSETCADFMARASQVLLGAGIELRQSHLADGSTGA
jgi:hypothetical protein